MARLEDFWTGSKPSASATMVASMRRAAVKRALGVARIDAAALVRAPDRVYERSLGQVTAPRRRSIL